MKFISKGNDIILIFYKVIIIYRYIGSSNRVSHCLASLSQYFKRNAIETRIRFALFTVRFYYVPLVAEKLML